MAKKELSEVIDKLGKVVPQLIGIFAAQRREWVALAYRSPETRGDAERIMWAVAQGTLYGAMEAFQMLKYVTDEQVEKTKRIWNGLE